MGEYLVGGLQMMKGEVYRSAADLMSAMAMDSRTLNGLDIADPDLDLSANKRSGDVVIEMNQMIDGRQFAKATARFTRDELDKQDRLKLRLAGGV